MRGVAQEVRTLWDSGALGGLDDGVLLERFLRRDASSEAAFEALVRRHGPMVLRVCRRVLGDPHDAHDAAQATFLILARKAGTVRRRAALANWLFGTAQRVAARARRADIRRKIHERRSAELGASRLTSNEAPDETRGWPEIFEELERLPGHARTAIVLCDLEGLSHEQAANQVGCPLRTLQTRLYRGRDRLRRRLVDRGVMPAVSAWAMAAPGARDASATTIPLSAGATARAAIRFAEGATPGEVPDAVARMVRWGLMQMIVAKLGGFVAAGLVLVAAGSVGLAGPDTPERPADTPNKTQSRPALKLKRAYTGIPPVTTQWHVLNLRVVDDATGLPIPEAQAIVLEYIDLQYHTYPTDADGRLRISYPTIDDGGAHLEVRKDGYIPQRYGLDTSSERRLDEPLTVRLRSGMPIGGTVVDEQGHPIADAEVIVTVRSYVEPRTRPKIAEGTEITYEVPATTDPQGRWRCAAVSPDAQKINLQLIHPDYASGGTVTLGGPGLRHPELAELKSFSDRQVMVKGVEVMGKVVDEEGRPIAGAEVVDATKGATFLDNLRRTTSDAEGLFRFRFSPDDSILLGIAAKGYASTEWTVRTSPTPVEIRLARGRTIRGRLVDDRQKPIVNALIIIAEHLTPKYKAEKIRLWTDAEGRFIWDGAHESGVPLSFSKRGYLMLSGTLKPTEGETTVTLKPNLAIKIKVFDSKSGQPVVPYELEVYAVHPTTGASTPLPDESRKGLDDEYTLHLDRSCPTYKVLIKAQGHANFESHAIQGNEKEISLDVRLEKTPSVPLP